MSNQTARVQQLARRRLRGLYGPQKLPIRSSRSSSLLFLLLVSALARSFPGTCSTASRVPAVQINISGTSMPGENELYEDDGVQNGCMRCLSFLLR